MVKADAKAVLTASGPGSQEGDAALRRFDRKLLEKRIAPGGSANLLAASLFLDCLGSAVKLFNETKELRRRLGED